MLQFICPICGEPLEQEDSTCDSCGAPEEEVRLAAADGRLDEEAHSDDVERAPVNEPPSAKADGLPEVAEASVTSTNTQLAEEEAWESGAEETRDSADTDGPPAEESLTAVVGAVDAAPLEEAQAKVEEVTVEEASVFDVEQAPEEEPPAIEFDRLPVAEARLLSSYKPGGDWAHPVDRTETTAPVAVQEANAEPWAASDDRTETAIAFDLTEPEAFLREPLGSDYVESRLATAAVIDKPPEATQPPKRKIARRTLLIGGLSIAGLAMAGSLAVWIKRPQPAPSANRALLTYRGHKQIVTAVAWSPDKQRVVSSSYDGTAQVWDADSGQRLTLYQGSDASKTGSASIIWDVAWSPDGKRIASAGEDGTVQVWDATTGKTLFTYKGHSALVRGVAWSPNGTRIASASYDYTVQVWDAADGGNPFTYRGHTREALSVAWSPNGARIVSSSNDYTAQVWDAGTGAPVVVYKGHANLGNGVFRGVYSVAWSHDGTRIASGASDSTAQIWDAATGKTLLTYRGTTDDVRAVAWSPDGTRLACAGDTSGSAQVLDTASGKTVFTAHCHALVVDALSWSPDGGRIASGSFDRTACIWAMR